MTDMAQQVKEIIADIWRESPAGNGGTWQEITDDIPLYSLEDGEESLGLDSLDALEIAMVVEERFDVVLPTEIEPADFRTVRQVVEMLNKLISEQR